jgi:transcriptional regulator with XRE-family HTH domain
MPRVSKNSGLYRVQGHRIRQMRERQGYDQMTLAYHAGVTQGHLSNIENGKVSSVGTEALVRLSNALDTSPNYLLGLTTDPRPLERASVYDELMDDEALLLDNYQSLSPLLKKALLDMSSEMRLEIRQRSAPQGSEAAAEADA